MFWCDVDLDGKTAAISQQLQQYDGHLTVCPPKTPHSIRTIALDHTTVAALRAHRDRQRTEASAFGPGYHASGYVFTGLNGHPMAPDRLSRTFKKLAGDALRAGCLVPGTRYPRRRQPGQAKRRRRARRPRAHPERQVGRPPRRSRAGPR